MTEEGEADGVAADSTIVVETVRIMVWGDSIGGPLILVEVDVVELVVWASTEVSEAELASLVVSSASVD